MRTTLDLDDRLIEALRSRHPDLSTTKAIETALRVYLASDAVTRIRQTGRLS